MICRFFDHFGWPEYYKAWWLDFMLWLQYETAEERRAVIQQIFDEFALKMQKNGYLPVFEGGKFKDWKYDPALDSRNVVS